MKWLLSLITAFIICVPSVSEALDYDCGKLATMIVTHPNSAGDKVTINGVVSSATGSYYQSFQCSGIVSVTCSDTVDFTVTIIPFSNPYQVTDFSSIVSFLIGSLSAIAFVVAVDSAWKGGSV